MEISFSRKKWERIFREIDRNYDSEISFQEFFLFLFPDHDLALALEMRRLKVISRRVASRANYFLSHLSPFRDSHGDRSTTITATRNTGALVPRTIRLNSTTNQNTTDKISHAPADSMRSVSNRDFETPEQRAIILARLARKPGEGSGGSSKPVETIAENG